MRPLLAIGSILTLALVAPRASAETAAPAPAAKAALSQPKAWCAPETIELSDHVCYADGGVPADGRRTLVIYLHGALAHRPGFAHMQQRTMAREAKRNSFTVLIPTGPSDGVGYVWPTSPRDRKEKEPEILAGLVRARAALEKRLEHGFDEVFVVGFSSGAYYGSSLALRGALDVDGYVILAGATPWVDPAEQSGKRAPIFVGVSAADPLSRNHSRALAGTLGTWQWPRRVEERNAGHGVDSAFVSHALGWLREKRTPVI